MTTFNFITCRMGTRGVSSLGALPPRNDATSAPSLLYPGGTPPHSAAQPFSPYVPVCPREPGRVPHRQHTDAPASSSPWCAGCSALLDWAIVADDGEVAL
jgi:hypothetical protein